MKVAIIGAGTCGLYLGWKLAKAGNQITIFERDKEIGNKVCSGLFSERILDFVPGSRNLIENEIHYVLLHFPRKTIKINFSKRFLVMNHTKLDRLLLDLCHNSGVEILLGNRINSLPEGFDRIIGCDGADSFVRSSLKLEKSTLRIGIQGFDNNSSNNDFVETWPCKNGFLWRIPRIKTIEYGVMADQKSAYALFTNFLGKKNIKIKGIKARMIPGGFALPNNETVTLCGDSAGLTKPWSGGGVIWGLTAADMLIKDFPNFINYEKRARKFFTRKIFVSKFMTKAAYFFGFNFPWLVPSKYSIESDFLFN